MSNFLGFDTSNYTTSIACVSDKGEIIQNKKLLPVKEGELGLRQSDAVFHHVQQLPELTESLFKNKIKDIKAVGCSTRPRAQAGSYMPCFTVGMGAAKQISSVLSLPLHTFSHQQGHIAAALFSAKKLDLINTPFIAFHVSGGTTEALLVEGELNCNLVANSLDLKAGQSIDRVGKLLGLRFPAGPYLEKLALQCDDNIKCHVPMKGADCSLSGVQNQCEKLLTSGAEKSYIAKYCLSFILTAIINMTTEILKKYKNYPVVYAGGVMSNDFLKANLKNRFNSYFAEPVFSSDNAAGIAVLTAIKEGALI